MNELKEIFCEKLSVFISVDILEILELKIKYIENEHGFLYLKAIMQDNANSHMVEFIGNEIKVFVSESKETVFRGVISNIELSQEGKYAEVSIECISLSFKLDITQRNESFQNQELTYHQVIHEIMKNYDDKTFQYNMEEKNICKPMIQYLETDWDFFKRLASHFNSVIYPNPYINKIGFGFGIEKGNERSIESAQIISFGFSKNYYSEGGYTTKATREQSTYIVAKSMELWKIGDYIHYKNKTYKVFRITIEFINSAISYVYELGKEGMYSRIKKNNQLLQGRYLPGTVKKTIQEKVYIQLDIDSKEKSEHGWPWVPDTGNLSYCMPEIGTKAVIYFPTGSEEDGLAIHSKRDGASEKFSEVENRELLTVHGKKLRMNKEEIFFKGSRTDISLHDTSGIKVDSKFHTIISAAGEVFIEGNKVTMNAPLEVVYKNKQCNIELCRDINLYAPGGVKVEGTDISIQSSSMSYDTASANIEQWKASYTALAAIPAIDLSKADQDSILDIVACGSLAKVAKGSTTIALEEVMSGKKESEISFSSELKSMESYTVKGGYKVPDKS